MQLLACGLTLRTKFLVIIIQPPRSDASARYVDVFTRKSENIPLESALICSQIPSNPLNGI